MSLKRTDTILIILHIFLVGFVILWVWMFIDALFVDSKLLKHSIVKDNPDANKLIWVLIIVFAHWFGALIYYILEKRDRVD